MIYMANRKVKAVQNFRNQSKSSLLIKGVIAVVAIFIGLFLLGKILSIATTLLFIAAIGVAIWAAFKFFTRSSNKRY